MNFISFVVSIGLGGLLIGLSVAALAGGKVFIRSIGGSGRRAFPGSKTPRGDQVIAEAVTGMMPRFYAIVGIAMALINLFFGLALFDPAIVDAGNNESGLSFKDFFWMTMLVFIVYVWPVRSVKSV